MTRLLQGDLQMFKGCQLNRNDLKQTNGSQLQFKETIVVWDVYRKDVLKNVTRYFKQISRVFA